MGDEDESMKEDVREEAGDESEEDTKQGIIMQPMEDSDDDLPLAKRKKPAVKRKVESGDESDDEPKKKSKGFKREPSFDPYEGVKWRFLEHKGPYFCVPYEPLPEEVRFWYDGKVLRLTEETEECATFY